MPVTLSNSRLEDPKSLRDDLRRQGLPVGEWAKRCHSFVSPVEREPGVGHVLIKKSDWNRIADQTSLTLRFEDADGYSVEFVKLHPASAPTPVAQETFPIDPWLWLTLEDRRSRFKQVEVDGAYNLRTANGDWDEDTLNAGTAYTWAEVLDDLWAKLKAVYTDLPSSTPSLPSTPSGTPESFYFYHLDAWTAFCTVCQAAGFLAKYDPTLDVVSVIDPSSAAPDEPNRVQFNRTWDTAGRTAISEAVPAEVVASYRRVGRHDRHQIAAAVSESGATSGASLVLPAYPAAAGDPVSNTTYLTAFAGRVRDFWRRDAAARAEPRAVQFRGVHEWCSEAVGFSGYARWSVSQLASGEVQTGLTSGPLMRLDPGEPYPSGTADDVCGNLPLVFRVQVGTSFSTTTVSGTAVVTGIEQRFRDITIDEYGCISLGDPYCVDAADEACTDGEEAGSPKWWCVSGVCWEVYDGITPPGGVGPYTTAADCEANCAGGGDGEPGGDLTCCDPDMTGIPVLRATLDSGEGTIDLTWDGSAYWQGSKTLTCGEQLHVRYSEACIPEYSCDGSNWLPVTTGIGSLDCDVGAGTFSDTNPHDCDMDDANAGCAAGSCGTIQITEVATP